MFDGKWMENVFSQQVVESKPKIFIYFFTHGLINTFAIVYLKKCN